jgi:hypothetical protein
LVGEGTKNLYRFVRWEIDLALRKDLPIIAVNLNNLRPQDYERCLFILRHVYAVHVAFKMKVIQHARDHFPDEYTRRDRMNTRVEIGAIRGLDTTKTPCIVGSVYDGHDHGNTQNESLKHIHVQNMNRDLHQALKTETVQKASIQGVNFVVVKHQWGKNDLGFSLHAEPTSFSTSGTQTTDFLAYLGFERKQCAFVARRECFAKWVEEPFDLARFAESFSPAYGAFDRAERHLQGCGFGFDQLEGWGYFMGRSSRGTRYTSHSSHSDGHTAAKTDSMKTAEDESFKFAFTWIESDRTKGWTTHYRPKNTPLSSELTAVFDFLKLRSFDDCPEFDFDSCYWRFTPFESRGNRVFDSNAGFAHGLFNATAANFSPGIKNLLEAHRLLEPFNMKLLPFKEAAQRREEDIQRHMVTSPTVPTNYAAVSTMPKTFDVAVSFSGTERKLAEELATVLVKAGYKVFYDNFYPAELWGKDLFEFFEDIYRKRSRYCVMFISKEYADRMWTTHERKSAQARALEEKGKEYILPIKIDATELPGMLPTVGHLSLSDYTFVQIADLLIKKLRSIPPQP